ncbi:MAG: ATP-binding cassette domain-containing protein [Firmicutes bacterium]|nr:ATP-binding cassette domain-containing protein [Bacillota bacterium]
MRIDGLVFSYGENKIFDGLTLDLPDFGITAVTGASGCGKTTLFRIIAGFCAPDGGKIDAPRADEISFLFQEDRLFPNLTAAEQIRAVLPRRADAERWLSAVGLSGEGNTRVESLSGGMRRRVALARCMAFGADKKLMLLDEPFTGVDLPTAKSIIGAFREMSVPVIFSTHDTEIIKEADTVTDIEEIIRQRG